MDLAQLKHSRAARRPAITKLLDELKQAITNADKAEVEVVLERVKIKEINLLEINKLLEIASDAADVAQEVTDNEQFNDIIVLAKIQANRFLHSTIAPVTNPVNISSSNVGTVSHSVRLPKLEIPRFDGTLLDWPRFRDAYNASVGNSRSLSNTEKFSYLRSLLKENANLTIAGLSLTDANFAIAWSLLESKYGNEQLLIAEHIKQLYELRRVFKEENIADIRRLLEDFEKHTRSLQNLGQDLKLMGSLVTPLLLKALPSKLVKDWHRLNKGLPVYDTDLLVAFVKQEIKCAELTYTLPTVRDNAFQENAPNRRAGPSVSNSHNQVRSTSSSLVAANENPSGYAGRKQPGPYCVFCDERGTHDGRFCSRYASNAQRYQALKQNHRCTKCLRRSHEAKDCRIETVCRLCRKKNHYALLCSQRENNSRSNSSNNNNQSFASVVTASKSSGAVSRSVAKTSNTDSEGLSSMIASTSVTGGKHSKNISILQTIRLWVKHAGGLRELTTLIDNGSQRSFITKKLVDELQLEADSEEDTVIRSFGGHKTSYRSKILPITLVGSNGVEISLSVVEVPEICHGVRIWETGQIEKFLQESRMSSWSHLMGYGSTESVDVLIGADFYWRVMSGREKRVSNSLMATHSHFGWLLMGSAPLYTPVNDSMAMCVTTEKALNTELSEGVKRMWMLDSAGILLDENHSNQTVEEVEVLQAFEKSTERVQGRYQVRVPWNHKKLLLSDNYDLALERLRKLTWKLSKDELLHLRYKSALLEYLKNGHAEEVFEETRPSFCSYLPHHAIINDERKTTKTRIVFDASAKPAGGTSLNDAQYTGANLNPLIFDLLLRFRWHKVAIVTDLSKAFLQILLHPEDRDATRFLWTDHPWKKGTSPILRTFRMTSVLFGMRASPFLLAAAIRLHAKRYATDEPELIEQMNVLTYVDDHGNGSETTQQAFELSRRIYQLMSDACMNFAKWATNDEQLRQLWITDSFLPVPEPPITDVTKVLGLLWNPLSDEFCLKTTSLLAAVNASSGTKRNVLEILARVYDPLGVISPVIVVVKKLLQDLWRLKIDWDTCIPEQFQSTWEEWKADIQLITEVKLPRWLRISSLPSFELHVFCDASPRIFAAVCYVRFYDFAVQRYQLSFLASRCRLSPMQLFSVPRLELLACLIGSRLASHITTLFKIQPAKTVLWSDSKVALRWIEEVPSQWKLFVGRRVQEIQELTSENCTWHYCASKRNIADLMTRGVKLSKLLSNDEWLEGPVWLRSTEEDWDSENFQLTTEDLASVVSEQQLCSSISQVAVQTQPLFDYSRYSSWKRIIRITAWILRFCTNAHRRTNFRESWLIFEEIKVAELFWISYEQQINFPAEYKALLEGQTISRTSDIFQFNPFLDSSKLIRVGGRLKYALLTEEKKHPLLLRGGGLASLLILDRHLKTLHGGVQATLSKLRDEVWLLRGRQTVRTALRACMSCRRWNAQPAGEVEAPLPVERIKEQPSFFFTGVDFGGPVDIKGSSGKEKAYICLFTCGVTRAVHLELVTSLSTANFILAFRRFFARRGGCRQIFSDNAATFKQMDRLLRGSYQWLTDHRTQEVATQLGIEWRFIAPRASWWAGFYERLIGCTKYHLRRSLGNALLSADELYTLLTEIESVLNNRPLSPITEDQEDHDYLTPSHFLLGRSGNCLADSLTFNGDVPASPQLQSRWKYRSQLLKRFWQQWRKEYLLQLRTAHQVRSRQVNQPIVKLNDVVLKMHDKLPRGRWQLCRVVELSAGRDGKIRSVLLRTPDGSILRRAVQHVCPLEMC